ncbi:MAG: hypothetical protein AUK47_09265 [Deltaproteobacteria bacterium CG2_30_63_29]|nr:MAG: hypothetical protein AUK47_09265 [Deltaproteobacteria bacterium CG2_30_63_29]
MKRFLRQTAAILGKELRVELRTREILYTMIFFGLVIVVVFGFGLFEKRSAAQAAPGVLWTALLLAGTVSVNRTFEREREGSCMTGLMMVPGIAWSLFLGKAMANLLFLLITLAVVGPLVLFVFQYTTVPNVGGVALTLFLGALGYSILGTLVGGMLGQVRMKGILLPLVLFPMILPVFGIGVTATAALLTEGDAQSFEFLLDEVKEGDELRLELDDVVLEVTVKAGDEPGDVIAALSSKVTDAIDRERLRGVTFTRISNGVGFTLVSDPGKKLETNHSPQIICRGADLGSKGWGYLPVLAALDFLFGIVAIWLFGRLLDSA